MRRAVARNFFLLTTKPTIYAANVEESALADLENNSMVNAVREVAAKEAAECVVICAQLEADLVALPPEERVDYLKSLNVDDEWRGPIDQERVSPARLDVVSDCG